MMKNCHFKMADDGKLSFYVGGGWKIVIFWWRRVKVCNFMMADDGNPHFIVGDDGKSSFFYGG